MVPKSFSSKWCLVSSIFTEKNLNQGLTLSKVNNKDTNDMDFVLLLFRSHESDFQFCLQNSL